jgi:hypothetical protein
MAGVEASLETRRSLRQKGENGQTRTDLLSTQSHSHRVGGGGGHSGHLRDGVWGSHWGMHPQGAEAGMCKGV